MKVSNVLLLEFEPVDIERYGERWIEWVSAEKLITDLLSQALAEEIDKEIMKKLFKNFLS